MAERPRSVHTLQTMTRAMPASDDLHAVITALVQETNDRASAITCAALIDGVLESAILTKFRELTDAEAKSIFGMDGPLGSFSAKIRLGYALRLFGPKTRSNLDAIREIRNAFAHTRMKISFDMLVVGNVLNRIDLSERVTKESLGHDTIPRGRYALECSMFLVYFDGIVNGADMSKWHPGWLVAIAE